MLIYYTPVAAGAQKCQVYAGAVDSVNGFRRAASAERRFELSRAASAASQARQFVDRLLRQQDVADVPRETAQLVTSELVTNALRHGAGKIELRLRLLDAFLRIEVVDQGLGQAPAVRTEAPDESGGWGLRIVDQLSAQWGVFEGTTHVWADVAVS